MIMMIIRDDPHYSERQTKNGVAVDFRSPERLSDNRTSYGSLSHKRPRLVAHFEFLMASSLVDGVILSVAVLQAERRISATTLCATGDPSARW